MKVIDLLNKIVEGEQPEHIRVYNEDWYWNDYDGYVTKESLSTTPDAQHYLFMQYRLDFALDKDVEVIEDKDIPLIPDDELYVFKGDSKELNYNFRVLKEKINQVVEKLNKGDK